MKILRIMALLLLLVAITAGAQQRKTTSAATHAPAIVKPGERPEVLIETTMGNIRIQLYNETPQHRDNFLKLIREYHFYDSLLFHRVIPDFMIQAGDPTTRKVTPGKEEKFDTAYTVPAEIRYPKYYHKRGQLCAAREGDDENPKFASAPCDFYITWGRNFSPRQMEYTVEKEKREGKAYVLPNKQVIDGYIKYGGVPHLDGGYTVFGEVLEGMDVVDKIQTRQARHP